MQPEISADILYSTCIEETNKFLRDQEHNPNVCLKLIRTAFQSPREAFWDYTYQYLERFVRPWVYNHPKFHQTNESVDYFVNVIISKFWMAIRKRIHQFQSLRSLLQYLKMVVHSVISDYRLPDEPIPPDVPVSGENHDIGELWRIIKAALPNEQDQLLAEYYYRYELKPAQIYELHPNLWKDPQAISARIYSSIRPQLYRNYELRQWFGISADSE